MTVRLPANSFLFLNDKLRFLFCKMFVKICVNLVSMCFSVFINNMHENRHISEGKELIQSILNKKGLYRERAVLQCAYKYEGAMKCKGVKGL